MKPDKATADLRWTASCYVLGELSAEETVRFEARLLEDQEAREAVADAVALMQAATAAATASVLPAAKRVRTVAWAWAAVALALMAGIAIYFTPKSTELADAAKVEAAQGDAWLLELPDLLGDEAAAVEPGDMSGELEAIGPEDSDGEVPAWLILATAKRGTP